MTNWFDNDNHYPANPPPSQSPFHFIFLLLKEISIESGSKYFGQVTGATEGVFPSLTNDTIAKQSTVTAVRGAAASCLLTYDISSYANISSQSAIKTKGSLHSKTIANATGGGQLFVFWQRRRITEFDKPTSPRTNVAYLIFNLPEGRAPRAVERFFLGNGTRGRETRTWAVYSFVEYAKIKSNKFITRRYL